jgi:hypothetical protein
MIEWVEAGGVDSNFDIITVSTMNYLERERCKKMKNRQTNNNVRCFLFPSWGGGGPCGCKCCILYHPPSYPSHVGRNHKKGKSRWFSSIYAYA